MNAESLKWTTIAEIEHSGEISCIDGRHDHCVVGAPGGNIGEVILLLAAAERISDMRFSPEQLEQFLEDYSGTYGRFYMHTDTHAMSHLLKRLELDNDLGEWATSFNGNEYDFFSALLNLDISKADTILHYLLMPRHTGCGHLRLLIRDSHKLQVRTQLVTQVISQFFRMMWKGNTRMHFEMLKGEHAEKQVVVIESTEELEDRSAIPFACVKDEEQQFVSHAAARRFFHKRDAGFLNSFFSRTGQKSINNNVLVDEIEKLSEIQLNYTLSTLAKDLPIIRVVFS